jgi:hypothetical protein
MIARTFVLEFFSRGLPWLRLLALSALVDSDAYAYVVLLSAAEAFIGELISYPEVRKALLARQVTGEPFFTGLVLWLTTSPLQFMAALAYFDSFVAAAIVTACSLSFSCYKIMLYSLRSFEVGAHNMAKFVASLVGTAIFFSLTVYVDPNFYLLSTASSAAVVAYFVRSRVGAHYFRVTPFKLWSAVTGWLHFGTQALAGVTWQYGNRFVAGASFSAATFSFFVRDYLIVSGITFVYSAIMIVYERRISVKSAPELINSKLRSSLGVFGRLLIAWVIYCAGVILFYITRGFGVEPVFAFVQPVNAAVLGVFMLLFLARAAQLVLAPLLTSIGDWRVVTASAVLSISIQIAAFALFWSELHPELLAIIMLSSLFASLILMIVQLLRRSMKYRA